MESPTISTMKKKKPDSKRADGQQCAALPFALDAKGRIRVLLLTSRETRRWVIPKGWSEPTLTPSRSAEREALEEAGLIGEIADGPLGTYRYAKRLPAGRIVACEVQVFPFRVERQLKSWREKGQRKARWVAPGKAAKMVAEPELAKMILGLRASG